MSSATCKKSIDSTMSHFTVGMGKASVQNNVSLWTTLSQCYDEVAKTFALQDPEGVLSAPDSISKVVHATFDHDEHGLIEQGSSAMANHLDDAAKAHMLAQAVAGTVAFFRRLASSHRRGPVTQAGFDREVRRFAECGLRSAMIRKIDESRLFGRCYTKSQIADLILDAVEGNVSDAEFASEDEYQNAIGWATELPARNMGLPWGFTIMAIN
ncbi:uncharacterized protein GLRG_05565 [Colletotrichum graminicola M1.001]|uniref:Uncharacterized protein n=1 Tax=Colletotrichum graminicola (strain M1.001 / M2 / FGSC 10212) TaxID=645133 RepID=E3QHT3_COLGM|nr:uncharacterized protein GLRG_05565 [Colletotrichum graminicola M1.001]EFQ30421.1 hypothetical protein GLRG_05565 [Colletotrichum graminicola M1.001]